jgi:O-antigen ligase
MIKLKNILPENNDNNRWLQLFTTMLFLAMFAFPLFPLKVSNIILILFALLTLILFFIRPVPVGKALLLNLVFIVPFIPYLIEFFVSGFDPSARFELEKKLFFFTAPLVIPVFMKVTGFRNYKSALLIFSLSVAAITLYTIIGLLIEGVPFNPISYENGAYILRNRFEIISGLHPTYYSIFALCAGCFLSYSSLRKRSFHVAAQVIAGVLFVSVLVLAVRIAFFVAMVFLLIWIFNKKIAISAKITGGVIAMAVFAILIFSVPSLNMRFGEITTWFTGNANIENTMSQRETIVDCSLKVFSDHMWLGTGSRDFQHELDNCYSSKGWVSNNQSFNPHNQFLSVGINYGIFFLLIFIGGLFYIFRRMLIIPEAKYFMIAVLFVFLSESILERQMGVYFFGLISLLFYNVKESLTTPDSMNHMANS